MSNTATIFKVQLETCQGRNFFRCQHTGALIAARYGIPNKQGIRQGCFADAAVALRYLMGLRDSQALDPKRFEKQEKNIYMDLQIKKKTMIPAPVESMDPLNPNFEYQGRKEYKKMLNNQYLIDVEVDLKKKESKKSDSKKERSSKNFFYTVKSSATEIGDEVLEDDEAFYKKSVSFNTITPLEYKRSKVVVIHTDDDKLPPNPVVSKMFSDNNEIDTFRGTVYINSGRRLHLTTEEKEKVAARVSKKRKRTSSKVPADDQSLEESETETEGTIASKDNAVIDGCPRTP